MCLKLDMKIMLSNKMCTQQSMRDSQDINYWEFIYRNCRWRRRVGCTWLVSSATC